MVTVLDVSTLFIDWLGWDIPYGHYHSWHDITIECIYDSFRAGDWLDDIGLIELSKLNDINYIPMSLYRVGTADTNKESDFAIAEDATTIGTLNPGQDALSWKYDPAITYHEGDASILAIGQAQQMTVIDSPPNEFQATLDQQDPLHYPANNAAYHFQGTEDESKSSYTSTQYTYTASGDEITTNFYGAPGRGVPVASSGGNNLAACFDRDLETSYTIGTSYRSYVNSYSISATASSPVEQIGATSAWYDLVVDPLSGYFDSPSANLGTSAANALLNINGETLKPRDSMLIQFVHDPDSDDPILSIDYNRILGTPAVKLNFDMDSRITPSRIPSNAIITLHLKAVGFMRIDHYWLQASGKINVYTVPISVAFGSNAFGHQLGESRFLYSERDVLPRPSTVNWETYLGKMYQGENLHSFDYTMTLAQFLNQINNGKGDIYLQLKPDPTYSHNPVNDNRAYLNGNSVPLLYRDVPYWSSADPATISWDAYDVFDIKSQGIYVQEASIEIEIPDPDPDPEPDPETEIRTPSIDMTISKSIETLSISAKV
nr:hypothetical protein [Candidatus Sigynarchaeota archaeon]